MPKAKKTDFKTMQRSANSLLQITGMLGIGAVLLGIYDAAPAGTTLIQTILAVLLASHGFRHFSVSALASVTTFLLGVFGLLHGGPLSVQSNWIFSITLGTLAVPFGLLSALQLFPENKLVERARIRQIAAMFALTSALLAGVVATSIELDKINLATVFTLGLVFLGGLFLSLNCLHQIAERPADAYRRGSVLALAAAFFVVVGMWRVSLRQEQVRYNGLIADHLESAANKSQEILREASNALNRYSIRVAYLGAKDLEFLEVDSESYLKQLPILRRIGLVNSKFETLWSYPKFSEKDLKGLSQPSMELRRIAFERAARTQTSILSSSLRLRSGDLGFILATALYAKKKNEKKLTGFVYGAIDAEKLFAKIDQADEFSVVVIESGRTIYSKSKNSDVDSENSQTASVGTGLALWEITVTPTSAFYQKNRSSTPDEVLFGGIFIAFVLAAIAHVVSREQNLNRVYTEWRNAILNGADYSIISTDSNGVIQTVNKTAERMLLYGASELVGKFSPERLHDPDECRAIADELGISSADDHSPGFGAFIAKARRAGFAEEIECSYIRKDGTCCPVRLSITPLISGEGQLDGYVCIATDITEKKRIEAKLQTTLDRLERVIKATGAGIWERDAQTKEIHFVDTRGKEIFGFGPDIVLTYEMAAKCIHPDDLRSLGETMDRHVQDKSPGFEADFRIYNAILKEERWVRATGQIAMVDGVARNLVTTLNDVTTVVRNRKKLELALSEAETATHAKSAFLASMSHEIRTPLNGVIGMASLLLESGLETTQLSYASVIYQSGNTLLRLINDILDFSKIEAGKMELEASPFDLTTLVETQADLLIAKAQQKHITLSTFVSLDLDGLHIGDAGRISQILLNLVSNSVKFTQNGGVLVSVAPVTSGDNREIQWIRFEVRDTGIGVSPELAKKLFQPFVQADASIAKRFGGTGLGLSISSRLVDLMGGKIGVDGVKDVGSTFWFEIPLGRVFGIARDSVKARETLAGRKALLIDEDPSVREVLGHYLRDLGVEHVDATPGASFSPQLYDYVFFGESMREGSREAVKIFLADYRRSLKVRVSDAEIAASRAPTLIAVIPFGKKVDEAKLNTTGVELILSKPIKRSVLMASLEWRQTAVAGFAKADSGFALVSDITAAAEPRRDRASLVRFTSNAIFEEQARDSQEIASAQIESQLRQNSEQDLGADMKANRNRASGISKEISTATEAELNGAAAANESKTSDSSAPARSTSDNPHRGALPDSAKPLTEGKSDLQIAKAKCRILVADDNSINQIVARSILTKLGYRAAFAANGIEVLDMLQNATFDLILMDCQMPDMDGFEATRRIREIEDAAIRNITIIALTANASEKDSRQCFAAGMNDFLAKPIVAEELDKMLTRWIVKAMPKAVSGGNTGNVLGANSRTEVAAVIVPDSPHAPENANAKSDLKSKRAS